MSPEATAKLTITKNSEFQPGAYASIPAGELVVFAVQVLQADTAPVAVEEVVSTCFRFFPHSFALKNYFYWPDSALVSRRLHDAKEKGLLKGSPADGFETKVQGRQVAKHVAKTLGVSLPVAPKVEILEPVEKKEEVPTPVKVMEKVETAVPSKEKPKQAVKAVKKAEPKPKKTAKKKEATKPIKKKAITPKVIAKPKKEAAKVIAPPIKKKAAPKPKKAPKKTIRLVAKVITQVKHKQAKPLVKAKKQVTRKQVKPVTKTKIQAPKVKVEKPKAQRTKSTQPTQLTMSLTPPAAWKKAQAPVTKPKVKEESKPVKVEVLAPVAASKEEKFKAAKVIKQIERSDAYQLYRHNGKRAQIGEFDFRNMLFATMESSAETLKRNVELFKRYAGIHFRSDLIAFLEFCEVNFAELLKPKAKLKR